MFWKYAANLPENIHAEVRATCFTRVHVRKFLCNFIEIALRHGCSPVNLLHIFKTPFLRIPLDGCLCFNSLIVLAICTLNVSLRLQCLRNYRSYGQIVNISTCWESLHLRSTEKYSRLWTWWIEFFVLCILFSKSLLYF